MSAARRERRKWCPRLSTWERRVEKRLVATRERLAKEGIYFACPMAFYYGEAFGDLGCRKVRRG